MFASSGGNGIDPETAMQNFFNQQKQLQRGGNRSEDDDEEVEVVDSREPKAQEKRAGAGGQSVGATPVSGAAKREKARGMEKRIALQWLARSYSDGPWLSVPFLSLFSLYGKWYFDIINTKCITCLFASYSL